MKLIRLSELFEKAFQEKARKDEVDPKPAPKPAVKPLPLYDPESRTKLGIVAGGEILWKPINVTARRVIQPAPWWAKLLYGTPDETLKTNPTPVHSKPKGQPNNQKRVALRAHDPVRPSQKSKAQKVARKETKESQQIAAEIAEREKLEYLKQLIHGKMTSKEYYERTETATDLR